MSAILVLEHVNKTFKKRLVVQDMSFSVEKGEVFGFLGPNGAGKTTTIKMILGLLSVDSGTILIDGKSLEDDFEGALSSVSGIVENPDMYGYLSGYDNLMLHARACGVDKARVDEVVALVGMQMRVRDKFKSYSLGMKQRLGVAQALLHNPKMLILDEPTNGLDPAGIKEFRDLLSHLAHTEGLAVLVSSHILQEMQLMCDRVGIINNGVLLQVGTMEDLTGNTESIFRYVLRPLEKAVELIRAHTGDRLVAIGEDYVDMRITEEEMPVFNRKLMENDISIFGVSAVSMSLEQSFIAITGGGNVIE